jgi:spore coat polysaccharide biosynthesis protein SpsF
MMMGRKLVAVLACRVKSTRLYGKPLQYLDIEKELSILDHIIDLLAMVESISEVVLAVSEAPGNELFHETGRKHGIACFAGSEEDVLQRHLDGLRSTDATDLFLITSESPFVYYEVIDSTWDRHCKRGNDITAIDTLPDGCGFTIATLSALLVADAKGEKHERGDATPPYLRRNSDIFTIETIEPPAELKRPDLRLTVDYPEDLVVCRRVYEYFKDRAPRIPIGDIIQYLDDHPEVQALVEPYVFNPKLF